MEMLINNKCKSKAWSSDVIIQITDQMSKQGVNLTPVLCEAT